MIAYKYPPLVDAEICHHLIMPISLFDVLSSSGSDYALEAFWRGMMWISFCLYQLLERKCRYGVRSMT